MEGCAVLLILSELMSPAPDNIVLFRATRLK